MELDKLNHYGIGGKANDWFKSYLKTRNSICLFVDFNQKQRI